MKIEKLELKHICGYLPHEVKCVYENDICQLQAMSIDKICRIQKWDRDADFYWVNNCDIKLLLLPLSALTEPLKDGSIPIVEIGKMLGFNNLTPCDVDGVTEYGWDEHICDDYQGYSFGWSEELMEFGVWYDNIDGSPISTHLNFDVIEYLYSKHFDIYGLIDAGLAIDKRTVKI